MNETYWVLEKDMQGINGYYAGDARLTFLISEAFRYGTKELAEEFLSRTTTDKRIAPFNTFVPMEYQVEYKKVGR